MGSQNSSKLPTHSGNFFVYIFSFLNGKKTGCRTMTGARRCGGFRLRGRYINGLGSDVAIRH